jgi:hypothetical protein
MGNWRRIFRSTSFFYVGKSTIFKMFLVLGVIVISAFFIWYSFGLISTLQEDLRDQVQKYVTLWQMAANSPTSGENQELQYIFNEIIVKAAFPIVVCDESGEPISWRNIEGVDETDHSPETVAHLRELSEEMKLQNGEFKLYYGEDLINYLYYGESAVIRQLKIMPFIQIGIVLAFLLVGFVGFQNIRRSEERYIWVGMAKETAHQLGTPISSLMGWIEVLEAEQLPSAGDTVRETVDNMRVDVGRLQRVANRFGMIGSVPELAPASLNELVAEVVEYYRRRLPFEGKGITIDFAAGDVPPVGVNPELITWALENLVKNSLQAVDSKDGRIEVTTGSSRDSKCVDIELTDNGKGISAPAARKIFRPGFTTKKRGWGLGLTLVKRIIEEYHGGSIRLTKSRPGETVFTIQLPASQAE